MTRKLFYILFLLISAISMSAQSNVALDANMHVVFETAGQKEYRTVQYALFKTATKAASVMQQLQAALAAQRGDNGSVELDAWEKAVIRNKVKFRTSKGNGDFRVHAYPDMAVLVSTYLPDEELTIEDARFTIITIKDGMTDYTHTFQLKMDSGAHTISNVDVLGTNRDTITISSAPAIDDGKNMYFKVHIELPAGYGNERGRLVVQPMGVDCQTEDTVDYIKGLVMEGTEYHKVQNRRMRFNYMKYDKVAPAYINRPMYSDEKIYIDTTLVYVKPDRRKTYKIPYNVQIADFNHVYFDRSCTTGSCNAKNIFKFLDLGVAAAQMDLEDFRIDAESVYDTKNRDLKLNFVVGKSELTADSINQVMLHDLIKELKSYGDQLMEVSVSATASPDGSVEANKRLAAERTRVAANKVRSYLGKVDVAFHIAQPTVYTWDDVAKEKALDTLATEEEILQRMRTMRVTYRYEREHVMDEHEVRQAYYQRKHDLLHGRGKDFSDGELGVRVAALRGIESLDIYGAMGGRPDHFLYNLHLLKIASDLGVKAVIRGDKSDIYYSADNFLLPATIGDTLSIVPFGESAHIIKATGLKYPAEGVTLTRSDTRGLSNECVADKVFVATKGEGILLIHSFR